MDGGGTGFMQVWRGRGISDYMTPGRCVCSTCLCIRVYQPNLRTGDSKHNKCLHFN